MVEIPLRTDLPHFTVVVELDGLNYRLEFTWNTRESCWYMHMYDADEALIQSSLKCVVGWLVGFLESVDSRRPPGGFLFHDTSRGDVDPTWTAGKDVFFFDELRRVPGYGELGDRVRLYYVEVADLAA